VDESERRRTVIETFASLALEGLHPTTENLNDAWDYIEGNKTLEQILVETKAKYGIS